MDILSWKIAFPCCENCFNYGHFYKLCMIKGTSTASDFCCEHYVDTMDEVEQILKSDT